MAPANILHRGWEEEGVFHPMFDEEFLFPDELTMQHVVKDPNEKLLRGKVLPNIAAMITRLEQSSKDNHLYGPVHYAPAISGTFFFFCQLSFV